MPMTTTPLMAMNTTHCGFGQREEYGTGHTICVSDTGVMLNDIIMAPGRLIAPHDDIVQAFVSYAVWGVLAYVVLVKKQ